ncbi:MAG: hypothetical protein AVDCRST_MAG33-1502 [uncultured Thermomicrobiales bacterium]|uniref:Uncharacterized protein n=1 Tax=uncultured Thermomicrobiales bacterium TaxID=1645740 RepID=A0A6J4UV41_9BACT|nr:MAG: hypothetical protein AVDCRST_MAG33-1502 [uncultured Thermomicrobiales bacterium]
MTSGETRHGGTSIAADAGGTAFTSAGVTNDDRPKSAGPPPLTLRSFASEFSRDFTRTGVPGQATQFAYSLFFAIFPTILLVMSVGALLDTTIGIPVANTLRDAIDDSAPEALKLPLLEIVERAISRTSTGRASFGIVVAIMLAVWSAAGAVGSLVNACNRSYGVRQTRTFLAQWVINASLAAVVVSLIVLAAVLLVFGASLSRQFTDLFTADPTAHTAVLIVRWFLVISCALGAVLALYWVGPNLDLDLRWQLPGASFAAAAWLILVLGFNAALRIANPGDPYGAFGSLVILLWFLYATGIIIMLGAILNAILGSRYDERRRAHLAMHPEKLLFCADGREVG